MAKSHHNILPRLALLAALGTAACGVQNLQAQSADALLDKLVEKGVLTADEATGLRDETDKNFSTAFAAKTGMPDWVTALKINGDFRGRFDGVFAGQQSAGVPYIDRNRFRYRLRLGIVANLADDFEVGMRLTSSEPSGAFGGDPISGNSSFNGGGSKKFVYLDLAYAKWNPIHNADWAGSLTVGKMENPFVFPSTLVFDKDYTPEGAAIDLTYRLSADHALRAIGGGYVLREVQLSSNDSYLAGAQFRSEDTWSKKLSSTVGVGFFGILGKTNLAEPAVLVVPNVNRGNGRDASGNLLREYNSLYLDGALTYTLESFPFNNGSFPLTVSGDYLKNTAAEKAGRDTGYSVGVQLGKSGKKGTWDLSYRYTYLGADAWYEETTESDFGAIYFTSGSPAIAAYAAGTGVRGHNIRLSYSPYDSLTLSVSLFATKLIDNPPASTFPATTGWPANWNGDAYRLLVDAVWKF
jgi:hypothetical protein